MYYFHWKKSKLCEEGTLPRHIHPSTPSMSRSPWNEIAAARLLVLLTSVTQDIRWKENKEKAADLLLSGTELEIIRRINDRV